MSEGDRRGPGKGGLRPQVRGPCMPRGSPLKYLWTENLPRVRVCAQERRFFRVVVTGWTSGSESETGGP